MKRRRKEDVLRRKETTRSRKECRQDGEWERKIGAGRFMFIFPVPSSSSVLRYLSAMLGAQHIARTQYLQLPKAFFYFIFLFHKEACQSST